MKLGFLYAGQGSQAPGMGKDLYEAYPRFRAVYDGAPVDFDLKETCFTGEDLNETKYTQPCMVAFAAGVTALLRDEGVAPDLAAGLSLGEYSALCAAGVWDAPTAVRWRPSGATGHDRSRPGHRQRHDGGAGSGPGEAPGGLRPGVRIWAWCRLPTTTAPASWSLPANGRRWSRRRCTPRSWAPGGLMPLKTSGPFHTKLLEPASRALHDYFPDIPFGEMRFPVLFNCLGDMRAERTPSRPCWSGRSCPASIWRTPSAAWPSWAWTPSWRSGRGRSCPASSARRVDDAPTYAVTTAEDFDAVPAQLKGARNAEGKNRRRHRRQPRHRPRHL